ncbi:MAG: hypothetical protein IJY84_07030 [Clostridia bacterium]|nr:hypothetical protein [Clostridia bacterium]
MARFRSRNMGTKGRRVSSRKGKKKEKYTKVEKAAYMNGLIARGLKNPESRISEAYGKGKAEPKPKEQKKKKTLF